MDPLLVPRHYNRLTAGALCYYPVPCNERGLRANANGVPFREILRSHARAGIGGVAPTAAAIGEMRAGSGACNGYAMGLTVCNGSTLEE